MIPNIRYSDVGDLTVFAWKERAGGIEALQSPSPVDWLGIRLCTGSTAK